MARTNKKWIAAKKAQLQKQAGRLKWEKKFNYPKRKISIEQGKELWFIWAKTNPKGNTFNRFLKWRKICWETRLKVDTDWFSLTKLPSGWLQFVEVPVWWWLRKKMMKAGRWM